MPDTIFQFLCRRATGHRWRKLTAYSVGIDPVEYHYTCRLCRKHFWNYTVNPSELEQLNHRMANQCVICGAEMPEGDQVCGYCRRQHGY